MNDTLLAALVLVIAAFVVLIYRQTVALQAMSGSSARANDRDRRDMFHLIERLAEKRDAHSAMDVARLHMEERINHTRVDAAVEQTASKLPEPLKKPESEYCTPEQYEE